jgi:hypothetical protein
MSQERRDPLKWILILDRSGVEAAKPLGFPRLLIATVATPARSCAMKIVFVALVIPVFKAFEAYDAGAISLAREAVVGDLPTAKDVTAFRRSRLTQCRKLRNTESPPGSDHCQRTTKYTLKKNEVRCQGLSQQRTLGWVAVLCLVGRVRVSIFRRRGTNHPVTTLSKLLLGLIWIRLKHLKIRSGIKL